MTERRSARGISIFGFPLRVSPWFLLITATLGWREGAALDATFFAEVLTWVGVVTVSILWHELGHAVMMRRFGFRPAIALHGLGGHTSWGPGPRPPTPGQRLVVSLAGPFAGFVLGGVAAAGLVGAAALGDLPPAALRIVELLVYANLFWGALNLLPMVPWDGGMALEALIDRFAGRDKGRRPAAIVTIVVAVLVGVAAWYAFETPFWALFLCGMSVATAVRLLRGPPRLSPEDAQRGLENAKRVMEAAGDASSLTQAVLSGKPSLGFDRMAFELERRIAPAVEDLSERAVALELAAWASLLNNDPERSAEIAESMRPAHDPSALLASLIALRSGRPEDALAVLDDVDDEAVRARVEAAARVALSPTA